MAHDGKNIISYVELVQDTLRERPLGSVDSLVLSQLSYLRLEHVDQGLLAQKLPMRLKDLSALPRTPGMFQNIRDPKRNGELVDALGRSARFGEAVLSGFEYRFEPDSEKQFTAMTFLLPDGSVYVAFRGTDATMIGWKEDLNMAFMPTVPSQEEGAAYLEAVAGKTLGPLRVGGHSKGGNIAVYAAAHCGPEALGRLVGVYSHDGPGFHQAFFDSSGFGHIRDRVHKTLPESSVIGMLMEQQEPYVVVRSRRMGIMQHDPFAWVVEGGDFVYLDAIHASARFMDATLNQWAASVDDAQRGRFINAVYEVISATGAQTIHDLTGDWQRNALAVAEAVKGMDPESRRFVLRIIRLLLNLAADNLGNMIRPYLPGGDPEGREGENPDHKGDGA